MHTTAIACFFSNSLTSLLIFTWKNQQEKHAQKNPTIQQKPDQHIKPVLDLILQSRHFCMQDTFKITLTKLRTAFLPHRRSLPLHFFRLSYSIQGLPIWNIPLTLAIGSGDQSLHKILCVSQKPIVFLKQVNLLNSLSHESIQNTRKNKLIWMKSYLMPDFLCLTVNNSRNSSLIMQSCLYTLQCIYTDYRGQLFTYW